jgi:Exocyst complex component Sec10
LFYLVTNYSLIRSHGVGVDCQVEHIILTRTKPREYYPPEDDALDLGPTKGCTDAIKCLDMHCKLLKGSTSREVLEVFYQEVGIRLIACVPCRLLVC